MEPTDNCNKLLLHDTVAEFGHLALVKQLYMSYWWWLCISDAIVRPLLDLVIDMRVRILERAAVGLQGLFLYSSSVYIN